MKSHITQKIRTISEFHQLRGLPQPEHPLISVVDYSAVRHSTAYNAISSIFDFYSISIKRGINTRIRYGQQSYDFDAGIMYFMAPGQVLRIEVDEQPPADHSGWILLIHPDFLCHTPLARTIRRYGFFDYAVNEALFLSEREEATIAQIIHNIRQEYHANIDPFSQNIIISQIETLLNYSERFYQRQFITRKITNHRILDGLEDLLETYFSTDVLAARGLPTVQYLADALHVSPGYLSGLLKVLTGQSAQQHIHDKLIKQAKERLSTTDLSVSEIAYELGFEHPQSFNRLFRQKTNQTPMAFRQSFSQDD